MSRKLPKPARCFATGKKRWPDREAALLVLRMAATGRHFAAMDGLPTNRQEVRAYNCTACRGWHTTSQQQWATAV